MSCSCCKTRYCSLAISQGKIYCGCEDRGKGGMVEALVIIHPDRGEGHIIGLGRDFASLLA